MQFCSVVQEWFELLGRMGWPSGGARRLKMCRMLIGNELLHWTHLEEAGQPETWPGAEAFREDELVVLRWIANQGAQVPE